jgi:hypothetical protein
MFEKLREVINQPEVRETWQQLTRMDKLNLSETERLASLVGGGSLLLYGLFRRSPVGLASAAAGGYLMYRGLTGHCPAYEKMNINTAELDSTGSQAFPANFEREEQLHGAPEKKVNQTLNPDSMVDESVWESFPASDPPASW